MGFFSRILGISKTKPPQDASCWRYENGQVEVDLNKASELSGKGGAIRLEGGGLPVRVLVVHGEDDQYHALHNKCTHAGRRLDPLPGQPQLECCSVGKSKFEYNGKLLGGSAKEDAKALPLEMKDSKLIIKFS